MQLNDEWTIFGTGCMHTLCCWRFPCMFVLSYRAAPSSLSPSSPPLCSHFSLHYRGQGSAGCVTEPGQAPNTLNYTMFCFEERWAAMLCEAVMKYEIEINTKNVLNIRIIQRYEVRDIRYEGVGVIGPWLICLYTCCCLHVMSAVQR